MVESPQSKQGEVSIDWTYGIYKEFATIYSSAYTLDSWAIQQLKLKNTPYKTLFNLIKNL